jgi:hypothetical protein
VRGRITQEPDRSLGDFLRRGGPPERGGAADGTGAVRFAAARVDFRLDEEGADRVDPYALLRTELPRKTYSTASMSSPSDSGLSVGA